MTEKKRETAHKNVGRNYKKIQEKTQKKKIVTLLKKALQTPFTQKIRAKF